ncbi:MAG: nitronate monooxygenase [Pseudomonadales bacterium]
MIIQGGMGVGVSGWQLARAVSERGQLGVVAGTALATTLVRRLQLGDPGGFLRRALEAFPVPDVAQRICRKYFLAESRSATLARHPLPALRMPRRLLELTVVANFVEVYLAREGHDGPVGLNLLEKVQLPTLASLFGAMLAGVDYVLMGAGIPRAIPGVLDKLSRRESVSLAIDVAGARAGERWTTTLDPTDIVPESVSLLKRPRFLAIVSSDTLATTLARKSSGQVDGFVIEGPSAGGHNAPPRGPLKLTAAGEPVYGTRDEPDLDKIRSLGLPFWMAGSYGRPGKLTEALALGASGVQVGTAFAFCEESGMRGDLKQRVLRRSREQRLQVHTDALASPTGFPLKVVELADTVSDSGVVADRPKICDLGYLRQSYRRTDGTVGYRCPGEPEVEYLDKGGARGDTIGRKCVCNGLLATVGLAQVQKRGYVEPPLVTAGEDARIVAEFLPPGRDTYTAADVIQRLLGEHG